MLWFSVSLQSWSTMSPSIVHVFPLPSCHDPLTKPPHLWSLHYTSHTCKTMHTISCRCKLHTKSRTDKLSSLANLPVTKHTAVVPSLCNSQPQAIYHLEKLFLQSTDFSCQHTCRLTSTQRHKFKAWRTSLSLKIAPEKKFTSTTEKCEPWLRLSSQADSVRTFLLYTPSEPLNQPFWAVHWFQLDHDP